MYLSISSSSKSHSNLILLCSTIIVVSTSFSSPINREVNISLPIISIFLLTLLVDIYLAFTCKEPTKEDILNRCKERTKKLDKANSSYEKVSILIDNYDDMKTLGMDTKIVDEKVVEGLRAIREESKGDPKVFSALMNARIEDRPR